MNGAPFPGGVGYFWISRRIGNRKKKFHERGFLQSTLDGYWELRTLEEEVDVRFFADEMRPKPQLIVGMTEEDGVLLIGNTWRKENLTTGARKASINSYRGHTVVSRIDPTEVSGSKLNSIYIMFPDLARWTGLTSIDTKSQKGDQEGVRDLHITLKTLPDIEVNIYDGRVLKIGSFWEFSGSQGDKRIYAPVKIGIESRFAKDVSVLLEPLIALQDLVNMAYEGFVAADRGFCSIPTGMLHNTPVFWSRALMYAPNGVDRPSSMNEVPLFSLANIGGIAGIGRWVRLHRRHMRAVQPLVSRHRIGRLSPDNRMMEVAAAIEYWLKAHEGIAQWPKNGLNKNKKFKKSLPLARKVGSAFDDWVGDSERWATEFWDNYNSLKHDAARMADPLRTQTLAECGAVLLMCDVLNRVARNKRVGNAILRSHRMHNLGETMKMFFK